MAAACPLFYAPSYFVDIDTPQRRHVFPMEKFAVAAAWLVEQGLVGWADLTDPGMVSEAELLRVHQSAWLAKVRGLEPMDAPMLRRLGLPLVAGLYDRSRAEVAGTLAAARSVLSSGSAGVACNLAGGTHHAFADRGEGFCVFNDVAVAIRALHAEDPLLHVLVLDLDAHHGNGTAALFAGDERVFTTSIHVAANYPLVKPPSRLDVGLERFADWSAYEPAMRAAVSRSIETFEPDLCFYIAGVDCHEADQFGQMRLHADELQARDRFVLKSLASAWVPTVVLYGGGYQRDREETGRLHARGVGVVLEHATARMA